MTVYHSKRNLFKDDYKPTNYEITQGIIAGAAAAPQIALDDIAFLERD